MDELLETEPLNSKALYLRGKALFSLRELSQAQADFAKALEVEPNNKII